jgi:hypothetical protein
MKNFIEIGQYMINIPNISFIETTGPKCVFHFISGESITIPITVESLKATMNKVQ